MLGPQLAQRRGGWTTPVPDPLPPPPPRLSCQSREGESRCCRELFSDAAASEFTARDVSGHHNPRSRRRGKGREDRKPSQQAILRSLPPRGRKNWASWSWPAAAGRDGGRSRPPASVFFLFPFLIFLQGKLGTSVPTGLPYGLQIPATPRDSLVLSLECLGRGASSLGQAWDIAQCRKFSAVPEADGGGQAA